MKLLSRSVLNLTVILPWALVVLVLLIILALHGLPEPYQISRLEIRWQQIRTGFVLVETHHITFGARLSSGSCYTTFTLTRWGRPLNQSHWKTMSNIITITLWHRSEVILYWNRYWNEYISNKIQFVLHENRIHHLFLFILPSALVSLQVLLLQVLHLYPSTHRTNIWQL